MQLQFKKNEISGEVEINMKSSTSMFDKFSYINMIRELVKSDSSLEESLFEGDFTEEEKIKIAELLESIEKAIITKTETE